MGFNCGVMGFTEEAVHITGVFSVKATTPCGVGATALLSDMPRESILEAETLHVLVFAATVYMPSVANA